LAFYAHLPAGSYRFQVIACNNDGVWNELGAELRFFVAPSFYETLWFKVLLCIALLLLAWWAVRLHIRQVSRQLGARHAERLSERERIARELHDTLLQDFQAAILQFHLVGSSLRDEPARAALDRGLEYADHALLTGRNRIREIRHNSDMLRELSESLSDYGKEMAEFWPQAFEMSLVGEPYDIDVRVRDECYQVGHEAICNAFKHSGGSYVRVKVSYETDAFRMQVSDDGVGMEASVIEAGLAGHWGIIHMRERALQIGAQLEVWSEKNRGTTLNLTFRTRNRRRFWQLWRV
jgi:signal transduction histidine kinase